MAKQEDQLEYKTTNQTDGPSRSVSVEIGI